jgi:hypothetical protein
MPFYRTILGEVLFLVSLEQDSIEKTDAGQVTRTRREEIDLGYDRGYDRDLRRVRVNAESNIYDELAT